MSDVTEAQIDTGPSGDAVAGAAADIERSLLKDLAGAALAGLIFLAIFAWAYRGIDPDDYRNRDDGIITVSHARNFVEYGSVGVNPAGERVEGFSSPLQFLLFTPLYAAIGLHYSGYFLAVAGIMIALFGVLIYGLCLPRRVAGLFACGAAAWMLTRDPSFLEWHASGMENALTHGFFLLGVFLLGRMLADGRLRYTWVIPVAAASIARIESIYHIGPLVMLFVLCWLVLYRQFRCLGFAALFFTIWALIFAARWAYFGEVFPNTAAAQGISLSERAGLLLHRDPAYWKQSGSLVTRLFLMHHGWLLVPALLCLPWMRWNRRTVPAVLFLASLAATSLLSPLLFGEARLDPTRLSTQAALAIVALLVVTAVHVRRSWMLPITAFIAISGMWATAQWNSTPPYYLWFSEKVFAPYRDQLLALQAKYDIPRPTIANPDLGLMSWHKDFNILDLGMLGSPVLSQLKNEQEIADFFFDVAAPDLIELHGIWSMRYAYLFKDPRFQEQYIAEQAEIDDYLRKRFARNPAFKDEYGDYVRSGYWVRRDSIAGSDSPERRLVDALQRTTDLGLIQRELERCKAGELRAEQAMYIVRTAYRFLPEFVSSGQYGALTDLIMDFASELRITPSPLLARSTPRWDRELLAYVGTHTQERAGRQMAEAVKRAFPDDARVSMSRYPIAPGLELEDFRYEALEGGRMMIHLVFQCTAPIPEDWRIFMHGEVPPEAREQLPAPQRSLGFANWDPGFPDPPTSTWHNHARVLVSKEITHWQSVTQVPLGLHLPGRGVLGQVVVLPGPPPAGGRYPLHSRRPLPGSGLCRQLFTLSGEGLHLLPVGVFMVSRSIRFAARLFHDLLEHPAFQEPVVAIAQGSGQGDDRARRPPDLF